MIGASKSKVSKRTVPANEAQARPLGMDIVVKIVECLIVDPEMQAKPLEIILYGDSSYVVALFNKTLAIKNSQDCCVWNNTKGKNNPRNDAKCSNLL